MVLVLLRDEGVTLGTITAGGHADMALITQPLLSGARLMVLVGNVAAMALSANRR